MSGSQKKRAPTKRKTEHRYEKTNVAEDVQKKGIRRKIKKLMRQDTNVANAHARRIGGATTQARANIAKSAIAKA